MSTKVYEDRLSRADLLKNFKTVNNLLRKAGFRDGYERFSFFSDLLFLKLKNTFGDNCSWENLLEKKSGVKSYLEETVKPILKKSYGNIFESSLNIKDDLILIQLIEEIENIPLKDIDSDVKGDAFEFFLRNVTNGNKDLGEYYTPRHIVKMIVKLLNPTCGETIYDPCSGTGGFLLECFRYLREQVEINDTNTDSEKNEKTIKLKFIKENSIHGREITSTARIAKLNMILFDGGYGNLQQMDCLSKPINELFDIVVSNIPYSQKVEYGNLYDFPTKEGDSIFIQHIWKAVKKGGRMAVVVPDTFLYDNNAVSYVREKIIKESSQLIVISLPRGVFNPYTPTKTSILVATKQKNDENTFTKASMYIIRNDGFELGARRRPLTEQSDCDNFLLSYSEDEALRNSTPPNSIDVPYQDIVNNNYSLFPFLYMEHLPENKKNRNLEEIGKFIKERNEYFDLYDFENFDEECVVLSVTKNGIYAGDSYSANKMNGLKQKYKRVHAGDFAYNPHRINVGSIGVVPNIHKNMFVSGIYPVFYIEDKTAMPVYYLLKKLKSSEYQTIINDYSMGGARADLKIEWLSKIKVVKPTEIDIDIFDRLSNELDDAYRKYLEIQKIIIDL
jgi:type I restriction enzyme M protein